MILWSSVDHKNTRQIILDKCAEYKSPLHLFIDFENGFDSVNWDFTRCDLLSRSIPEKLIPIIEATHDVAKWHILQNGRQKNFMFKAAYDKAAYCHYCYSS